MLALDGCSLSRSLDGHVEIAEATPAHRAFPARITERFGICWKSGPDHAVTVEGREVRFSADVLCIRPAGCVWGTDGTGPVGFVSLDIDAELLVESPALATMAFVDARRVPQFVALARAMRTTSARRTVELVCDLIVALEGDGGFARERAPAHGVARRARAAIEARLAASPSVVELAAELEVSRFALTRSFKQQFGISPHAFAMRLKVERARDRLARGDEMARVAVELGFADQPHFARTFKRIVGITPGEYARSMRTTIALSFKTVLP